ncbi:MAG: putative toxin-antitoxin system toxin component, PIN family [Acidobacteria bacterium]|nr:putative toxin-antitoxin system toxin component, PIN family [Acidobacteriota bacterium]
MRVFLDTNVLVSAVATRGLCADVLREILLSHRLVLSAPLLAELKNTLRIKIGIPPKIISDFVDLLVKDSTLSGNLEPRDIDINDRDDILILSTALNGKAELFITGDKELLELGKIKKMRILSPRQFWEKLKSRHPDEH